MNTFLSCGFFLLVGCLVPYVATLTTPGNDFGIKFCGREGYECRNEDGMFCCAGMHCDGNYIHNYCKPGSDPEVTVAKQRSLIPASKIVWKHLWPTAFKYYYQLEDKQMVMNEEDTLNAFAHEHDWKDYAAVLARNEEEAKHGADWAGLVPEAPRWFGDAVEAISDDAEDGE